MRTSSCSKKTWTYHDSKHEYTFSGLWFRFVRPKLIPPPEGIHFYSCRLLFLFQLTGLIIHVSVVNFCRNGRILKAKLVKKKDQKRYRVTDCFDIEHTIIQNVRKILIHGSNDFWLQVTQGSRTYKVDSKLCFWKNLVLGPQIWNSRSLAYKSCCG